MKLLHLSCSQCRITIFRDKRRINEAKKFGWQTYCSHECQSKARNKQVELPCFRPGCKKVFKRSAREIRKVKASFCSRSCSARFYNAKREKKIKICANPACSNKFSGRRKYCSHSCIQVSQSRYPKKVVISEIQLFVKKHGRIPIKQELIRIYKPTRRHFRTWNNAIKAAGFEPNPVMFAKKYIANDGHKCDSLAEKIIDDWLHARSIKHEINYPYPGKDGFTVDFKVGKTWIEFFGLSGQLKKYDYFKLKKTSLAKRHKLKVIEIYPEDLFPKSKLDIILGKLIK